MPVIQLSKPKRQINRKPPNIHNMLMIQCSKSKRQYNGASYMTLHTFNKFQSPILSPW